MIPTAQSSLRFSSVGASRLWRPRGEGSSAVSGRVLRVNLAAAALLTLSQAALVGCSSTPPPEVRGLTVVVAPLSLQGVSVACYDVAVTSANEVVWARGTPTYTRLGHDQASPPDATAPVIPTLQDATSVCSDRYGNGAGGGIALVGPCDASLLADTDPVAPGVQNLVTVWVDGLYTAGVTAELGAWQDPCPSGCQLAFTCVESEDARVEFDFTILRQANQGFFDVAVNFDDIFCSAKFDTCYSNDTATLADDRPIELLFGGDLVRDHTGVFGFACTAGPGTNTVLAYGPITVTCTGGPVFTIDPTVDPGSNHTASPGVGALLHYGVYRGEEALACDDAATPLVESCAKRYWNLAFDLADLVALGDCDLTLTATAYDAAGGFANGVPTAGSSYPYIEVDTALTSGGAIPCQENALNDGGGVTTVYRGTLGGLPPFAPMCAAFDAAGVTNPCVGSCTCPAGYTLDATGVSCSIDDTVPATVNAAQWEVCPGTRHVAYSKWGARFHASFTPGDLNEGGWTTGACADPATCVAESGLPWWDAVARNGYLSDVGVWACAPGTSTTGTEPVGSWIGFSRCLDLAQSGDYLVGVAGDNHVMLRVDSVEIYQSQFSLNFYSWNVFKLHLDAGPHVIELFGMNDGSVAAFGAEISGPFAVGSIDTPTAMAAADYAGHIVFSTRDLRGGGATFDTSLGGAPSGTTCPDGYALDLCGQTPVCHAQVTLACDATVATCPCYDEADLDALAAQTPLFHYATGLAGGTVVDVLVSGDGMSAAGTVITGGQTYCIYSVGQGTGFDQFQPMDAADVATCNGLIDGYGGGGGSGGPTCGGCTGILGDGTRSDPFSADPAPSSCAGYATLWPGVQPPNATYYIDLADGAPYRSVYCDFTHGWELHQQAVNLDLAGTRTFCTDRGLQLATPTAAEAAALVGTFLTGVGAGRLRLDLDIAISGGCDSLQHARSNAGAFRTVSPYELLPGYSQCSSQTTDFILGSQLAIWNAGGYYAAVGTGDQGGTDHTSWTQVCDLADATQCLSFAAPEAGPFAVCSWCSAGSAAVGAWALDEGSGTLAGNSGTGASLDGAIVDATWESDTPTCASTHALGFDGVGAYVELGAPAALTQAHSFTIALWFKTTDADRDYPTLFAYWWSGGTPDAASYSLGFSAANGLVFMLQDDAGQGLGAAAGLGYGDGAWHQVAATYDHASKTASLYVDGALKNSSANPAFLGPDPNIPYTVRIGADNRWSPGDPTGKSFFSGSIDDVRFYARALAPCEVAGLRAGALRPHCP